MRLGIDLRPLQAETYYRGIGKSLFFFIQNLDSASTKDIDFVFYINKGEKLPLELKLPKNFIFIELPTRKIGTLPKIKVLVPKNKPIKINKKDVDIFLQYDFTLGIPFNIPSVTVFYDLIPLIFKNEEKQLVSKKSTKDKVGYSLFWRKYIKNLELYKKSSKIICISNASRQDLLRHFPTIDGKSVKTIYLGINKPSKVDEKVSSKILKILDNDYLLYVGGIDYRKNIVQILDSFFELKNEFPNLKLVTVGKEFSLAKNLEDIGWSKKLEDNKIYKNDVIWAGYVNQTELESLYKHAKAYVFPTKYEGFGLPVLEAMEAGCPVVSYNNSSIPEVAGDAALLAEDGQSLTNFIRLVLTDDNLRKNLIKKGKKQSEKFSWKENSRETINLIRNLASEKGIM